MSSHQVIARKWRPQTFADVVGQEHITRTLKNAILQDRIGYAYLFVGPRGTGKTTSARIFAKALNCRNRLPDGEPCCACSSCEEIKAGRALDVMEIDGASHNTVDHARDLISTVQYTPVSGRYKIYIIDEVHMLTPQAWNALLKTLEEPPSHARFLFATTEPHKILATILSRCQRLDLKRIPPTLIAERLRWIADQEKVPIEDGAITAIARAADGGMRDAQSIFDQMIAFCGGRDVGQPIAENDIMDVFGLASGSELLEIVTALFANDLGRLLLQIQSLADRGRDLEQIHRDLALLFRDLMVVQLHPDPARVLEGGVSALEKLKVLATTASRELVQRLLEGLMAQESFIRYALNKRVALEVVLIRVLRDAHSANVDDVIASLVNWKKQGAQAPAISAVPPPVAPPTPPAVPVISPSATAAPTPVVTPAPVVVAAPLPAPAPASEAPKPAFPAPSPSAPPPPVQSLPVPAAPASTPAPNGVPPQDDDTPFAMSDDEDLPPAHERDRDVDDGNYSDRNDAAAPAPTVRATAPAEPENARKRTLSHDPAAWERVSADPFVQDVLKQVNGRIIDVRG